VPELLGQFRGDGHQRDVLSDASRVFVILSFDSRQNVRLDLVGVGQLVHLVVKTDDREDLAQGFVVQAEFLDRRRV
jgi:hypothetical protein